MREFLVSILVAASTATALAQPRLGVPAGVWSDPVPEGPTVGQQAPSTPTFPVGRGTGPAVGGASGRDGTPITDGNAAAGLASSGAGLLSSMTGMGLAALQMMQDWHLLSPGDGQWEPDFNGSPQVPSSCMDAEGSTATPCGECFRQAYEKLDFVRLTLERLRAIYGSVKQGTRSAIAFGDSVSPSTGVAALQWQHEKRGIEAALANLGRTYDEKYEGLTGTLERALRAISDCEEEHFNEHNWYDRFGFIYYSFMRDRYKRSD